MHGTALVSYDVIRRAAMKGSVLLLWIRGDVSVLAIVVWHLYSSW